MSGRRILANGAGVAAMVGGSDLYDIVTPADVAHGGDAGGIEVIVTGGERLESGLVAALPDLRLVACFSTGYPGIDVAALRRRGIAFTHAAGVNAHDVADHAIALMLSVWHSILPADAAARAGRWRETLAPRPSLRGVRAGVVGLGRIGTAIADRLAVFGMAVKWWGPRPKPDAAFARARSLIDLAQDSAVLLIAMRADAACARQIDRAVLSALGPAGIIVNVSRGLLVDEPALRTMLREGALGGAGLDVFMEEPFAPQDWTGIPNVVLTPHIAGYTREAGVAMADQLRENVRRYFAGQPLLSPVDDDAILR